MGKFFDKLIAFLTCSSPDGGREKAPESATLRPKSLRKHRNHNSGTSHGRHNQIPLEYVARDAQTGEDNREHEIMGRRSSFSVHSPHETASELGYPESSPVSSEASSASDVSSIRAPTVPLLGPQSEEVKGRKCLVLDLDETLVHSSFKYFPDADFVIPVSIEGRTHNVYVAKRPGVDKFLEAVGSMFEVVIFTASVAKYGDPLLDRLGHNHVIHHRLFRESCYNFNGNYIKNLSQLGRPLHEVIIVDNSPASYSLHPQHAVPISTWFSDLHDNELLGMLPFLTELSGPGVSDVSAILEVATD